MYLSICKSPVLGTYLSTCKIPVLAMHLSTWKSLRSLYGADHTLYVAITLLYGDFCDQALRSRHISLFLWSSQISSKTVFLGLFFIIWRFLWSRLIWRFGVIRTRYILIRRFCVIDPPGSAIKTYKRIQSINDVIGPKI